MQNVEHLLKLLKSSDSNQRAYSARKLGEIENSQAVGPLIAALHDPEAEVRESAARSCGIVGDMRAIIPLLEMLIDSNRRERSDVDGDVSGIEQNAVIQIANRVGMPAIDLLIAHVEAYKSSYAHQFRVGAIISILGQLGHPEAVEAIIAFLEDEAIPTNKFAALYALGEIGDPRALPVLKKWASHHKHEVFHTRAEEAIVKIQKRNQGVS
jgi:HEAT repeat protein